MDDWKVLERQHDEHDMLITAEYTKPPEFCVRCGVEGAKLLKHGVQEQTFMDTPIHGKRVGIKVQRQRYRCADCKGTFQQLLPDMDEKRTMTSRLLAYIQTQSLVKKFTEVSHDVGVNEKTVRNIFNDFVTTLDANREIGQTEVREAACRRSGRRRGSG
jgi:transposase